MAENVKKIHYCPPEPWGKPCVMPIPTATYDVAKDRAAWQAHLRRVQFLRPMPRTTR